MNLDFKINKDASQEDTKKWGVLAHVDAPTRSRIMNGSAGDLKKYIKHIESHLKYKRKSKW